MRIISKRRFLDAAKKYLNDREANFLQAHSRPLQLTYGYLSAAPPRPDARAETVLADALRRNRTGSVIVSSRRQSRLSIFTAIAKQNDLQDRTAC